MNRFYDILTASGKFPPTRLCGTGAGPSTSGRANPGPHLPLLPSLLRLLPGMLIAGLTLAGCAAAPVDPGRSLSAGYAYPVQPEITFDMARGEEIPSGKLGERLAHARLIFLGEYHTEPRSHRFHMDVLETLLAGGRQVTVGLEMFPPSVNEALEKWRQGDLEEEAFLERSGWYGNWGYPWEYYRALFGFFQTHRIPLHGLNAEKSTRKAVRNGKRNELPDPIRDELAGLDSPLPPHRSLMLDILKDAGHTGDLSPGSPRFQSYYRVQRMWDRLMGARAARIAERLPENGVLVVLIGSGHLLYRLGANLEATRATRLPVLTLVDRVVEKEELDADGSYRVPLGMADLVRIYPRRANGGHGVPGASPPSLTGLKLEIAGEGLADTGERLAEAGGGLADAGERLADAEGLLRVKEVRAFPSSPLHALKADDVLLEFNAHPISSETALRLAYERLPADARAILTVKRKLQRLEVDITPRRPGHGNK